ncbi:adenylate/guanylate cyclase domain-containing protein [Halopseudomonas aestusnigri]|uniref:adenylate/guanylate cyclase domain-containing protein n=1 Tax=Halopseudomonas aestusnigri TaxID=857252 RepID=UPI001E60F7F6|nr:adenylate/guanylate cyclase domain-containing protein [Halopseudomonas aestusnigri]UGV31639.1 adenylate/guanylate cyclase domain-containing protein [Halopseudomonas aestusnigri]
MKKVFEGVKFQENWAKSRTKRTSTSVEAYAADSSNIFESKYRAKFESPGLESNLPEKNFGIIEKIHHIFGKRGAPTLEIGGHPDFKHLENTNQLQYGYAVSFFLDIKGSTKLGLIYTPEEVFFIKNTIIKCAIEAIQAFDGHVHRIMGDAVLAFFRGRGESPENAAIDAINCGTYLIEFMKQIVIPTLQEGNIHEDVGIRIGADYGPEKSVLWGMYGYKGASEVTATSFHVDAAAKLQQKAPRNRMMIGQSLKLLLDLHPDVIENRYKISNGERKTLKYLTPNYTDSSQSKINYEQYVISHKNYFDLLPVPESQNSQIIISAVVSPDKEIQSSTEYVACSRSISKPYNIKFKAKFKTTPIHPVDNLVVKFRVENHGEDASKVDSPPYANHETPVKPTFNQHDRSYLAYQWERIEFKCLHYMHVSVLLNDTTIIPEHKFALYVK